ncbi:C39 family peptidase [Halofilum ochraceum]|uniref:C39 family peptidase n=1 Tax=Halofilum ochraceum TaxID=1611323 RepID=UPI0009F64B38|nr:C39 family peptidase [Halofilum ochraceum]
MKTATLPTSARSPSGGRVEPVFAGRAGRPARWGTILACCGLVALLLSWPLTGHTARVPMGGNLPVGDLADKEVESMRERKYAQLVEQQTDFSCGAAALATILRYAYDRNGATEKRILKGLFQVADREKVRKQGFSLLDLKNFVEGIGMRGRGYRVAADTLGDIKIPTIALVDIEGYRHFVVVRQVEGERVFVGDPALGNRTMALEDFVDAWNGIVFAVIGPGFDEDTALLKPRRTLSARRLHDIYAPVPEAQTIGFGIRHTEIF